MLASQFFKDKQLIKDIFKGFKNETKQVAIPRDKEREHVIAGQALLTDSTVFYFLTSCLL